MVYKAGPFLSPCFRFMCHEHTRVVLEAFRGSFFKIRFGKQDERREGTTGGPQVTALFALSDRVP